MAGTSGAALEQTRVIPVEMPRMLREIVGEVVPNELGRSSTSTTVTLRWRRSGAAPAR
jgi:hypothetical protein